MGYGRTTVKGRQLLEDATNAGFTLLTNPKTPTRIGTSITRDSNPDLSFVRGAGGLVTWRNTGLNLGSDHYIIEMILPTSQTPARGRGVRQHRVTDWPRFRTAMQDASVGDITSIEAWTESLKKAVEEATDTVETSEDTQQMDSRLAHMLEAMRSLQNR